MPAPFNKSERLYRVVQGDYIAKGEEIPCPVSATENQALHTRKQQVMNSIIERMRAEKVAKRYEAEHQRKHPAATISRLREYA